MKKFMFDTNAFSSLLASKVEWTTFFAECKNEYEFFITSIQIEELAKIPDKDIESRIRHFLCLCSMNVKLVPAIAVLGHWRLGKCRLADENDVYFKLLKDNKSNVCDAMIGDAAYKEGCTLVTDDKKFIKRLEANNIPTMTFKEFCEYIGVEA